jgi:branched-chain amino acid aminotransferase
MVTLAKDLGFTVVEMTIPREMLFTVDELFFTGTAAEITPIRSVDRIPIGEGKPGPMTKELQKAFFDVIHNGNDKHKWLNFI